METFWQDIKFSFRTLRKNPGFTAVAILTLALGIGANSAIFTVVNSVLLRPLPYSNAEQLVALFSSQPAQNRHRDPTAPAYFLDWKAESQSFENMTAAHPWAPTLTGRAHPDRINGLKASASLFDLLEAKPLLGSTFQPEHGTAGEDQFIVLGYDLWQRKFGGDRGVIEQSLTLDGKSYTVIGVMPPGFRFPPFWATEAEFWAPLTFDNPGSLSRFLRVFARLRPGTDLPQAKAEMVVLMASLTEKHSEEKLGYGVTVEALQEPVVSGVRPALLVFLGAVGFVLLIACANVANLLLARAAAREKEMALRRALGAASGRIVRQLLTESLLLSAIGGLLGLAMAYVGVEFLHRLALTSLPRLEEIQLDGTIFSFTLLLSLATGIIFGLAPALQAARGDLNQSLRAGGRQTGGTTGQTVRSLLIVSEVALALVLLVGAGLLVKSFAQLQQLNPGFKAQNLLTMNIGLTGSPLAARQDLFAQQLVQRVEALPGVESAGLINHLHIGGDIWSTRVSAEGKNVPEENRIRASFRTVSPGFFRVMKIPLLQGRDFTSRDTENTQPIVVINRTLAETLWPRGKTIGQQLRTDDDDPWAIVVGVVGDVRQWNLSDDVRPEVYYPFAQNPVAWWKNLSLVVRAEHHPTALVSVVQKEIWQLDANLPVTGIRPMEQILSSSLGSDRFNAILLGLFSSVALLLAAIGLYGVISYTVTQRTQEIGVRVALGAQPVDIIRMILAQGGTLTLLGLAIGLAAAFALTRYLENLLFEITATDPAVFLVVTGLLLGVALLACLIPALRAAYVDPIVALRAE